MQSVVDLFFETLAGKNASFKFKSEPELIEKNIQKCQEYKSEIIRSLTEIV